MTRTVLILAASLLVAPGAWAMDAPTPEGGGNSVGHVLAPPAPAPTPAAAPALPASAQNNDAAYCNALVNEYQHYLLTSATGRHIGADQNAPVRIAIDKCKANDYSGIPVLEGELRNAKLPLPPHS